MGLQLLYLLGLLTLFVGGASGSSAASTAEKFECPCGSITLKMGQKTVEEMDRKVCDKTASNMQTYDYKLTSSTYCFYTIQFKACKDLSQCRTTKKADNGQSAFNAASIMQIYNEQDSNVLTLFETIPKLKDKNNYAQFSRTPGIIDIYLRCKKQTCRQLFAEGLAVFTNSTLYGQNGNLLELKFDDQKKLFEFFFPKMKELEDLRAVFPPRSLAMDPSYSASVLEMVKRDPVPTTTTTCPPPVQLEGSGGRAALAGGQESDPANKSAAEEGSEENYKIPFWVLLVTTALAIGATIGCGVCCLKKRKEVSKLKSELSSHESEMKELRESASKYNSKITDLKTRNEVIRKQEADLVEKVASLELEKAQKEKQVEHLIAANEKEHKETLETMNRVQAQFALEANKKEQEIARLKKVIHNRDVELNVKDTHLENLNKKLDALNAQNKPKPPNVPNASIPENPPNPTNPENPPNPTNPPSAANPSVKSSKSKQPPSK